MVKIRHVAYSNWWSIKWNTKNETENIQSVMGYFMSCIGWYEEYLDEFVVAHKARF